MVGLDYFLADVHPKPCPVGVIVAHLLPPLEFVEDAFQFLLVHADSRIRNGDADDIFLFSRFMVKETPFFRPHSHPAPLRIFDSVVDHI